MIPYVKIDKTGPVKNESIAFDSQFADGDCLREPKIGHHTEIYWPDDSRL